MVLWINFKIGFGNFAVALRPTITAIAIFISSGKDEEALFEVRLGGEGKG